MSAPIAQKKASLLIQSLNEMLNTGVNDVRLAEVEEEATKMKSYGMLADAYNVLGMVSSLRMSIQEVDRHFEAAIKHTGRDNWTLMNYAVALSNAYQYRRAVEIVDEVVESAQDDVGVIKSAITLHLNGYDAKGVRRLVDRLSQLGGSVDEPIRFDNLDAHEAAFSSANTSWGAVADRIGIAATAVSSVVKRPTAESVIYDGVVLFRFIVDATDEGAYRAESAMIEAIASKRFAPADRAIYFSCGIA